MRNPTADAMTAREAAEALGVGVSTIHRMCDALELPVTRTAGGHRRIPRAAVAALASLSRPESYAA